MKKSMDFNNIKMHVFSIIFILLVLVEFQIMINYPDQFIGFVGIGCLILIDVYLLISTSVKLKDEKYGKKEELFESINKSEKASYLLIKKCFQDLDERMDKIEKVVSPISNVVALNEHNTQKAINICMEENKKVAKIVIGRNKENAEALMNSNEEFKEKLDSFEKILSKMETVILQSDLASISQGAANGISQEQYQELLSMLNNLKSEIEEQMGQVLESVKEPVVIEKTVDVTPAVEPVVEVEPEPVVEAEPISEQIPEVVVESEPEAEPELVLEPEPEIEPEPVVEPEPEPVVEEEKPPMPDLSDPNKPMSPEDIAALLANMGADSEPTPEPEPVVEAEPEPVVEPEPEPVVEEEKPPMPDLSDPNKPMSPEDIAALLANIGADSEPTPEPEPMPEPEPTAEPVVEVEPESKEEIDDLFDPNKMMSPDDIAALLANMGVDSEPTPEPEPVVEPEPEPVVEEEKPPMPDLSDPNKIMSPEDIAALIANL